MKADPDDAHVGEIAVSLAGHDAGCLFAIIAGAENGDVLIADGKNRTLASPKRKKMRHLSVLTKLDEEKTEALRHGTALDSHVRKWLAALDLEALTK